MHNRRNSQKTFRLRRRLVDGLALGLHGGAAVGIWWEPQFAPGLAATGFVLGVPTWWVAWRSADGTALRPALIWMAAMLGLGALSQAVALFEPIEGGRPWSGHLVYLASLAGLAALIAVLNARRPGNGAWSILMGLMVVVMLIPWLEGIGLARRANPLNRLRLESPWWWFYLFLAVLGTGNYAPTRYGPAALVALLGFVTECLGLAYEPLVEPARGRLWTVSPAAWGAAWALAGLLGSVPERASGFDRVWLRFRDHWGAVWAWRIAERFHESSPTADTEARLGWGGLVGTGRGADTEDAGPTPTTEPTRRLGVLLRRFASRRAVERWLQDDAGAKPSGSS